MAVVRYCADHGIDEYDERARDTFLAEQDARLRREDIGPVFRSSLEKAANMLLEFKLAGKVEWRRRRPTPTSLRAGIVRGAPTATAPMRLVASPWQGKEP